MGAVAAAAVTVGAVCTSFVLALAAYHSGVNVFAWSQCRAMKRLGYNWVTNGVPRYERCDPYSKTWTVVCVEGSWYAHFDDEPDYPFSPHKWRSEIGFGNPIAAHTYAEVQGWRAQ